MEKGFDLKEVVVWVATRGIDVTTWGRNQIAGKSACSLQT